MGEWGGRGVGAGKARGDLGGIEHQPAGDAVSVVALLGDGQRDDLVVGVGDRGQHFGGLLGRHEESAVHIHQLHVGALGAELQDGVQEVLVDHRVDDAARAVRHAHDAPVAAGGGHGQRGVHGRVRSVELPDPQVDDAGRIGGGGADAAFERGIGAIQVGHRVHLSGCGWCGVVIVHVDDAHSRRTHAVALSLQPFRGTVRDQCTESLPPWV